MAPSIPAPPTESTIDADSDDVEPFVTYALNTVTVSWQRRQAVRKRDRSCSSRTFCAPRIILHITSSSLPSGMQIRSNSVPLVGDWLAWSAVALVTSSPKQPHHAAKTPAQSVITITCGTSRQRCRSSKRHKSSLPDFIRACKHYHCQ
jgi:hypothetical protein